MREQTTDKENSSRDEETAQRPSVPACSLRGEAPTWSTGSLTARASSLGPSPWAASPLDPRTGRFRVRSHEYPPVPLSPRVEAPLSPGSSSPPQDLGFARSAFVLLGPSPNSSAPPPSKPSPRFGSPPLRPASSPYVSPQTLQTPLLASSTPPACPVFP